MKVKYLLVLICVFLLTGCDIEYDLTIDSDTFDESINMAFSKSDTNYDDVIIYRDNKTPISLDSDEKNFYNTSVTDDGNNYNLKYNYKHNISSFKNSYFLNNCYPNSMIVDNGKSISFSSGEKFSCFSGDDGLQADSIIINITTDMKVLKNNADEVTDNTYTWRLDMYNYFNKTVEFELEKNNTFEEVVEDIKNPNETSSLTFLILLPIVLIGIIIFLFNRHKAKKNNNV